MLPPLSSKRMALVNTIHTVLAPLTESCQVDRRTLGNNYLKRATLYTSKTTGTVASLCNPNCLSKMAKLALSFSIKHVWLLKVNLGQGPKGDFQLVMCAECCSPTSIQTVTCLCALARLSEQTYTLLKSFSLFSENTEWILTGECYFTIEWPGSDTQNLMLKKMTPQNFSLTSI